MSWLFYVLKQNCTGIIAVVKVVMFLFKHSVYAIFMVIAKAETKKMPAVPVRKVTMT